MLDPGFRAPGLVRDLGITWGGAMGLWGGVGPGLVGGPRKVHKEMLHSALCILYLKGSGTQIL